jgi:hypothetical protein
MNDFDSIESVTTGAGDPFRPPLYTRGSHVALITLFRHVASWASKPARTHVSTLPQLVRQST